MEIDTSRSGSLRTGRRMARIAALLVVALSATGCQFLTRLTGGGGFPQPGPSYPPGYPPPGYPPPGYPPPGYPPPGGVNPAELQRAQAELQRAETAFRAIDHRLSQVPAQDPRRPEVIALAQARNDAMARLRDADMALRVASTQPGAFAGAVARIQAAQQAVGEYDRRAMAAIQGIQPGIPGYPGSQAPISGNLAHLNNEFQAIIRSFNDSGYKLYVLPVRSPEPQAVQIARQAQGPTRQKMDLARAKLAEAATHPAALPEAERLVREARMAVDDLARKTAAALAANGTPIRPTGVPTVLTPSGSAIRQPIVRADDTGGLLGM